MKFQVDSLSNEGLDYLNRQGHETERNKEWGDGTQPDKSIMLRALSNNRIVITEDNDFGKLAFLRNTPHIGIIKCTQDVDKSTIGPRIEQAVHDHGAALANGETVVITDSKVRLSAPRPNKTFLRGANAVTWPHPLG